MIDPHLEDPVAMLCSDLKGCQGQTDLRVQVPGILHRRCRRGKNRGKQLFGSGFTVTAGHADPDELWKTVHPGGRKLLQCSERVFMDHQRYAQTGDKLTFVPGLNKLTRHKRCSGPSFFSVPDEAMTIGPFTLEGYKEKSFFQLPRIDSCTADGDALGVPAAVLQRRTAHVQCFGKGEQRSHTANPSAPRTLYAILPPRSPSVPD